MKCQQKKLFYHILSGAFLFLCILSPVFAADLPAGFAPQSVWISKSNAVSGDSVNIFTVLYNSSDESLTGEIIFLVDEKAIGTKEFTLGSGETKIQSIPWTAEVGTHSVGAKISKTQSVSTNLVIALSHETTGSATVVVAPSPPPSKTEQALDTVTSTIGVAIASGTPVVKNVLSSVYETTESIREKLKSALEKQMDKQTDSEEGGSGVEHQNPGFLSKASEQAATVVLSVLNSKPLFYITLGLSFLFLLYLIRMYFKSRIRQASI